MPDDSKVGLPWRPWRRRQSAAPMYALRWRIAELEMQVQGLGRVLDNLAEGVVAIDRAGCVVHANQAAARLLGLRADKLIGHHMYAVLGCPQVCEALAEALRGESGRHVHHEAELERPLGLVELTIHATAVRDPDSATDDDAQGALAVVQDVTDYRRLETARADFFTNVSHELKTPVTAIRGIVETMRDDPAMEPEVRGRFLDKALGQSSRLNDLVTDLLSLSRLESDPGALDRGPVDLVAIANESITMCGASAEQHSVDLVLELGVPEAVVSGDDEALRRALSNLVVNAIAHSHAGDRVIIGVASLDDEVFELSVADTGTGIAAEDRDRIFERFYRADKARSRERGGTGLGLSIVKHAALAHGGDVVVESTVGIGSIFRLRIPSTT